MKRIIAVVALATATASAFAQSNLITNGTFDGNATAVCDVSFHCYTTYTFGQDGITGWTVGGTSVDLIQGGYGAITGTSVDMLGTPGPGSLSQSFATTAGQAYQLSFDLSLNGSGSNASGLLAVSLDNGSATNFFGTTNHTSHTLNFTGTGSLLALTFSSAQTGDYSGAVLDNVSVTAVPEPESYAMMLAGLGLMAGIARRRKGQQD